MPVTQSHGRHESALQNNIFVAFCFLQQVSWSSLRILSYEFRFAEPPYYLPLDHRASVLKGMSRNLLYTILVYSIWELCKNRSRKTSVVKKCFPWKKKKKIENFLNEIWILKCKHNQSSFSLSDLKPERKGQVHAHHKDMRILGYCKGVIGSFTLSAMSLTRAKMLSTMWVRWSNISSICNKIK